MCIECERIGSPICERWYVACGVCLGTGFRQPDLSCLDCDGAGYWMFWVYSIDVRKMVSNGS